MIARSVKVFALSSVLSCAAGCVAPSSGDNLGSTGEDVTTVCGAKTNGPVQGVDVSHYQGNFNWMTANVQFGYAQVSDGVSSPDAMFDTNWANMKKAKILRGAYQFFRPNEDEVAQANLVVTKIGKLQPGDLPAMIDVEVTGGVAGATIGAKVKKWLQIVEAGTGLKPFIYSGSYFWQDNVGVTTLGAYPIWIAAYGSTCPAVPPGWNNWLFWQYSDGAGALDHDVFNGTLAQLQAMSPASPTTADGGAPKDAAATDGESPASQPEPDPSSSATPPADTGGGEDGGPTEVSFDKPASGGGCSVALPGKGPSRDDSAPLATALLLGIAVVRRRRAEQSTRSAPRSGRDV